MWLKVLSTILVLAIASLFLIISRHRFARKDKTTRKGADEALKHIQEWAKWMAGIQTAALGALAYVSTTPEHSPNRSANNCAATYFFSLAALVFIGLGLLCAAWVLESIPSLALRVAGVPAPSPSHLSDEFDVYERPIFGFAVKERSGIEVRLGYLMTLQHWYWALGLISLGLVIFLRFVNLMWLDDDIWPETVQSCATCRGGSELTTNSPFH